MFVGIAWRELFPAFVMLSLFLSKHGRHVERALTVESNGNANEGGSRDRFTTAVSCGCKEHGSDICYHRC